MVLGILTFCEKQMQNTVYMFAQNIFAKIKYCTPINHDDVWLFIAVTKPDLNQVMNWGNVVKHGSFWRWEVTLPQHCPLGRYETLT